MQPALLFAGAILAAGATSFAVTSLASPSPDAAPGMDAAAAEARITELEDERARLEYTVGRLIERVDELSGSGTTRTAVPEVSDEQVKRALEELLAEQGLDLSAVVAANAANSAGDDAPDVDVDTLFAQLTDPGMTWDDSEALWKKVHEAGLTDEMVAQFEALAKAQPDVANAQTALGAAYLQKLFTITNDNEKGVWAMRADRAFDEALDIDPQHWDARFSKAISLSFWPAFMGRGSDAMNHFGILIEQQEANPQGKEGYDQSYLFLGNMHEQRGDSEKAREIWQRGYDLHPSSEELAGKVTPK